MRLVFRGVAVGIAAAALFAVLSALGTRAEAVIKPPTPIKHVVVLYQENHSFDEVLGKICVMDDRCNAVTRGRLLSGRFRTLGPARDVVPNMGHSVTAQDVAINGGKMNGFSGISNCSAAGNYKCYVQYDPSQIPNLAALARRYVISDHTFSMNPIPSWGAHLELVAAQLDGFTGALPVETPQSEGRAGWGCDSNRDAPWRASPFAPVQMVPSCVPDFSLNPQRYPFGGAYRPTPVKYVPTIMDRLNAAHRNWRIYASKGPGKATYGWAICPTFAECLYKQRNRMVEAQKVISDANNGRLRNLSIVIPVGPNSQHNSDSMLMGDNWIGDVVGAIQNGPQWRSTAIFITYDDCGCFYDHVPPPVDGWGLRMPTVIVSPYAKPGYTDSRNATFVSLLSFTEHVFGLPPLSNRDANGYDYASSFNFNRPPVLKRAKMIDSPISRHKRQWLKAHPPDPDDPT